MTAIPKITLALAASAAAMLAAAPAFAWDNQGHMATGAIAYDTLMRQDPQVAAKVLAIMAHHPDRARFDRELGNAGGAARDRLLFEYMARWPDDVGGTPYDRPNWHYAVKVVSPVGAVFPLVFGKAEQALEAQSKIAGDEHAPAAQRAIALCWMFHIVGDMQQPLHAGHWMSERWWRTDRAGTIAFVRRAPGGKPLNLHNFWDESADLPTDELHGADALSRTVEQQHPQRTLEAALPVRAAFDRWAAEDRALAVRWAYRGPALQAASAPEAAPVMDARYAADARAVSDGRIALGGYRLAHLLEAELETARR